MDTPFTAPFAELTFNERIDMLRETKMQQTREKQQVVGAMDHDDWALILPPPDKRHDRADHQHIGHADHRRAAEGFHAERRTIPAAASSGRKAVGENFRKLLEVHPAYVDPVSSLAGGYMVNFMSYRKPAGIRISTLRTLRPRDQESTNCCPGIGASQHFCQDLAIGLQLGWGGLLDKIRDNRALHGPEKAGFYAGLEAVVLGMQDWIGAHGKGRRGADPQRGQPATAREP